MEREKDLSELESRFVYLLEYLQFQNILFSYTALSKDLTAICYHSLSFRTIFLVLNVWKVFLGSTIKFAFSYCVFLMSTTICYHFIRF